MSEIKEKKKPIWGGTAVENKTKKSCLPSTELYRKHSRATRIRTSPLPSIQLNNVQQQTLVLPEMRPSFDDPARSRNFFTSGILQANKSASTHWEFLSKDPSKRCDITNSDYWVKVEVPSGEYYYYSEFTDSDGVINTLTAYVASPVLNKHFELNTPLQFPSITVIQTSAYATKVSTFEGTFEGIEEIVDVVKVCLGLTVTVAEGLELGEYIEIFGVILEFAEPIKIVFELLVFIGMIVAYLLEKTFYLTFNIYNYSNQTYTLIDYYLYNTPTSPQWISGVTKIGPKSSPPPPWGGDPLGIQLDSIIVTQENISKWDGIDICVKMKSDRSSDPIYFYFSKHYAGDWYADVDVGELGSAEQYADSHKRSKQETKNLTYGDNTVVMQADSNEKGNVVSFILKTQ